MPAPIPAGYGLEFLEDGADVSLRFDKPPTQWAWKPHDPANIADWRDESSPEVVTNYEPGPRRQRVVLLIGGDRDQASHRVLEGLRRLKVRFYKVNWDYLARSGRFALSAGRNRGGWLQVGSLRLDLRDVAVVHYDTPDLYLHAPDVRAWRERFWFKRWKMALRQLHAFTPGARWVPTVPELCGTENAQEKLAELVLAQECGLDVPDTLCSNSLKDIRAFLKKGPALFRDFSMRSVHHRGRWKYFRVGFVDARSRSLAKAASSPGVFQRWIDKQCDLRVVLVGRKVLACRIDSQASKVTRLDWRYYDLENVGWTRTALPRAVAAGLRRFGARTGMSLTCFDLALGRDGRHYFLEANRPGAYRWLREFAGVDVSWALARLLAAEARGRT